MTSCIQLLGSDVPDSFGGCCYTSFLFSDLFPSPATLLTDEVEKEKKRRFPSGLQAVVNNHNHNEISHSRGGVPFSSSTVSSSCSPILPKEEEGLILFNCPEGTQRFSSEAGIRLTRVKCFCFTRFGKRSFPSSSTVTSCSSLASPPPRVESVSASFTPTEGSQEEERLPIANSPPPRYGDPRQARWVEKGSATAWLGLPGLLCTINDAHVQHIYCMGPSSRTSSSGFFFPSPPLPSPSAAAHGLSSAGPPSSTTTFPPYFHFTWEMLSFMWQQSFSSLCTSLSSPFPFLTSPSGRSSSSIIQWKEGKYISHFPLPGAGKKENEEEKEQEEKWGRLEVENDDFPLLLPFFSRLPPSSPVTRLSCQHHQGPCASFSPYRSDGGDKATICPHRHHPQQYRLYRRTTSLTGGMDYFFSALRDHFFHYRNMIFLKAEPLPALCASSGSPFFPPVTMTTTTTTSTRMSSEVMVEDGGRDSEGDPGGVAEASPSSGVNSSSPSLLLPPFSKKKNFSFASPCREAEGPGAAGRVTATVIEDGVHKEEKDKNFIPADTMPYGKHRVSILPLSRRSVLLRIRVLSSSKSGNPTTTTTIREEEEEEEEEVYSYVIVEAPGPAFDPSLAKAHGVPPGILYGSLKQGLAVEVSPSPSSSRGGGEEHSAAGTSSGGKGGKRRREPPTATTSGEKETEKEEGVMGVGERRPLASSLPSSQNENYNNHNNNNKEDSTTPNPHPPLVVYPHQVLRQTILSRHLYLTLILDSNNPEDLQLTLAQLLLPPPPPPPSSSSSSDGAIPGCSVLEEVLLRYAPSLLLEEDAVSEEEEKGENGGEDEKKEDKGCEEVSQSTSSSFSSTFTTTQSSSSSLPSLPSSQKTKRRRIVIQQMVHLQPLSYFLSTCVKAFIMGDEKQTCSQRKGSRNEEAKDQRMMEKKEKKEEKKKEEEEEEGGGRVGDWGSACFWRAYTNRLCAPLRSHSDNPHLHTCAESAKNNDVHPERRTTREAEEKKKDEARGGGGGGGRTPSHRPTTTTTTTTGSPTSYSSCVLSPSYHVPVLYKRTMAECLGKEEEKEEHPSFPPPTSSTTTSETAEEVEKKKNRINKTNNHRYTLHLFTAYVYPLFTAFPTALAHRHHLHLLDPSLFPGVSSQYHCHNLILKEKSNEAEKEEEEEEEQYWPYSLKYRTWEGGSSPITTNKKKGGGGGAKLTGKGKESSSPPQEKKIKGNPILKEEKEPIEPAIAVAAGTATGPQPALAREEPEEKTKKQNKKQEGKELRSLDEEVVPRGREGINQKWTEEEEEKQNKKMNKKATKSSLSVLFPEHLLLEDASRWIRYPTFSSSISLLSNGLRQRIKASQQMRRMRMMGIQKGPRSATISPPPPQKGMKREEIRMRMVERRKKRRNTPNEASALVFMGTGSAVPSKYRNVSGTYLTLSVPRGGGGEEEEQEEVCDSRVVIVFDWGEGSTGQLIQQLGGSGDGRENRLFSPALGNFLRDWCIAFISHGHADHHLGLLSLIELRHQYLLEFYYPYCAAPLPPHNDQHEKEDFPLRSVSSSSLGGRGGEIREGNRDGQDGGGSTIQKDDRKDERRRKSEHFPHDSSRSCCCSFSRLIIVCPEEVFFYMYDTWFTTAPVSSYIWQECVFDILPCAATVESVRVHPQNTEVENEEEGKTKGEDGQTRRNGGEGVRVASTDVQAANPPPPQYSPDENEDEGQEVHKMRIKKEKSCEETPFFSMELTHLRGRFQEWNYQLEEMWRRRNRKMEQEDNNRCSRLSSDASPPPPRWAAEMFSVHHPANAHGVLLRFPFFQSTPTTTTTNMKKKKNNESGDYSGAPPPPPPPSPLPLSSLPSPSASRMQHMNHEPLRQIEEEEEGQKKGTKHAEEEEKDNDQNDEDDDEQEENGYWTSKVFLFSGDTRPCASLLTRTKSFLSYTRYDAGEFSKQERGGDMKTRQGDVFSLSSSSSVVRGKLNPKEEGVESMTRMEKGEKKKEKNDDEAEEVVFICLHEATFGPGLEEEARAKCHSTLAEAVMVGLDTLGADFLVLNHFSQRYPKIPEIGSLTTTMTSATGSFSSFSLPPSPPSPSLLPPCMDSKSIIVGGGGGGSKATPAVLPSTREEEEEGEKPQGQQQQEKGGKAEQTGQEDIQGFVVPLPPPPPPPSPSLPHLSFAFDCMRLSFSSMMNENVMSHFLPSSLKLLEEYASWELGTTARLRKKDGGGGAAGPPLRKEDKK